MVSRLKCTGRALPRAMTMAACLLAANPSRAEISEVDFLDTNTTVLSASRLAQPLMDAPNAVSVLDRETIQASGYRNLSDLFRLLPGMYVGQVNGFTHTVARTFADTYARRMQVLVDGRSVYLPTVGGVNWDALPIFIDDIERIEVVRGPNAATFGANAFTGVINIITRHAEDVSGGMLFLGEGDHNRHEAVFRWAGLTEMGGHRLTVGRRLDGGLINRNDAETTSLLNYRGDFSPNAKHSLTLDIGLLTGERTGGNGDNPMDLDDALDQPHQSHIKGGSFQISHHLDFDARQILQSKLNYAEHRSIAEIPVFPGIYVYSGLPVTIPAGVTLIDDLNTSRAHVESELVTQHSPELRSAAGLYARKDMVQSYVYFDRHDMLNSHSWGAFSHVEWRMHPHWVLNTGAFWEDYERIGGRLSPRLALNWQPTQQHTLRLGASRAYRNPVLFETDADFNTTLYGTINIAGFNFTDYKIGPTILSTTDIKPEEILSKEISYLGDLPDLGLSVDFRLYDERIKNYITWHCIDATNQPSSCVSGQPQNFINYGGAKQQGFEMQLKWQPWKYTRLTANHAYTHINESIIDVDQYYPKFISGLHLNQKLPGAAGLMVSYYWVGRFTPIGQNRPINQYRRLDAHFEKTFRITNSQIVFSFGVHNLGDEDYHELDPGPDNIFDTRYYTQLKVVF